MNSKLAELNQMTRDGALVEMMRCCGSYRWAEAMVAARPFANQDHVLDVASRQFEEMNDADWLEAFKHHPRIGERRAESGQTDQERDWSRQEQESATNADNDSTDELRRLNLAYEDRFGYIFIICATGRTSEEIINSLKDRLRNEQGIELRVSAREQTQIARLRLGKLLQTS